MDLSLMPKSLIEQSIIEGNIYFFTNQVQRGVKGHMHVCVKRADKLLFFSVCSSRIDTARNIAASRGWSMDTFPVYPKNEATNKFEKDFTYVNCNDCIDFTVQEFIEMMEKGEVELLDGFFTNADMQLIAKGVLASTQVPRNVKKLFK